MPPGGESAVLLERLAGTGAALATLKDDELLSVLIGWRRLTSWAQAAELEAVSELESRRQARHTRDGVICSSEVTAGVGSEISLALTLTEHSAAVLQSLAYTLTHYLPATAATLKSAAIDLPRARVIATGLTGLSKAAMRTVEAAVLPHAPSMTTGRLRVFVAAKIAELAPEEVTAKAKAAQKDRRVEVREDGQGTATLLGVNLPLIATVAAANRITALAKAFKNNGDARTMDQLRADVLLMCMLGHIPARNAPGRAAPGAPIPPPGGDTPTPAPSPPVPEPDTPEPDGPEPSTPRLRVPHPSVPHPGVPHPGVPHPGVPHPGVPHPAEPQPGHSGSARPEPSAPGTARPDRSVPETALPTTASPETASPETASPETASPETAWPNAAGAKAAEPDRNSALDHEPVSDHRSARRDDAARPAGEPAGRSRITGCEPWPQAPSPQWAPEAAYADVTPDATHPDAPPPCAPHSGVPDPCAAHPDAPHPCAPPPGVPSPGRPAGCWDDPPETPRDSRDLLDGREDDDSWEEEDGAPVPEWLTRAATEQLGGPHLTVSLATLVHLTQTPARLGPYAPLVADIARQILDGQLATGTKLCWTVTDSSGAAVHHGQMRYRPAEAMRRLVEARDQTCRFPTCRRPAAGCDLDHTRPYDQKGPTCPCNLAALCRRHHKVKQAGGWKLAQPSPGVLVWETPTGRTHTVRPDPYPL